MGEKQCPHCGHVVTGFESHEFHQRKAEIENMRLMVKLVVLGDMKAAADLDNRLSKLL